MKKTIPVTIEIEIEGIDPKKKTLPSFYETAAEITDERTPITRIGVSSFNPFVFFVFTNEGRNGTFAATINAQPMLQDIIAAYPVIVGEAQTAFELTTESQ